MWPLLTRGLLKRGASFCGGAPLLLIIDLSLKVSEARPTGPPREHLAWGGR